MSEQQTPQGQDFSFNAEEFQAPPVQPQSVPPTQIVEPPPIKQEEPSKVQEPVKEETPKKPEPKKVYTRNDIRRFVPIFIVFPKLYPDYEPFGFKFRLKLSATAQEEREKWLSLSAVEMTEKQFDQALDELCDLLTEMPTGFGDLQDTGKGPGHSFRSYVKTATDSDAKDFLKVLVIGANTAYWSAVAAHEFRPSA